MSGGGWSFDASRQLLGDIDGDGRYDVVSIHWQALPGVAVFVHRNTGSGFANPVQWQALKTGGWSYDNSRQTLADLNGDGLMDLVTSHRQPTGGLYPWAHLSTCSSFAFPGRLGESAHWRMVVRDSRQVAGDVNGDGRDDIISSHEQSTGGLLLWAHRSTSSAFTSPVVWRALKTGGWSYDRSRQLIADVHADGDDDLYSAHRLSTGQYLVWSHRSTRTAFQAPSLHRGVLTGYYFAGSQFATSRH